MGRETMPRGFDILVIGGGTAENAIAQVKFVDADKVAYAKLTK